MHIMKNMTMKDRLPADRSDRGPYDPEPPGDADLWFLPGPGEQGDPDRVAPSMLRADRRPLVELFEWQAAEAAQAAALARVAARFGALDERLRCGPDGWRRNTKAPKQSSVT